jgi:hypothetical protein
MDTPQFRWRESPTAIPTGFSWDYEERALVKFDTGPLPECPDSIMVQALNRSKSHVNDLKSAG